MAHHLEYAKSLSDDQLRARLHGYDYEVGPITITTRSLYDKKLASFLATPPSSPQASGSASKHQNGGTTRPSVRRPSPSSTSSTTIRSTRSNARRSIATTQPTSYRDPGTPTNGPSPASSYANFSDSENEVEITEPIQPRSADSSLRDRLLRLRRRKPPTPTSVPSARRSLLQPSSSSSIVTQETYSGYEQTEQGRSSFASFFSTSPVVNTSYNWIPFAIISAIGLFFVVVFSVYGYTRFLSRDTSVGLPPVPLPKPTLRDPELELMGKIKAPLCVDVISDEGPLKSLCLNSKADIKPALVVIREITHLFESRLVDFYCGDKHQAEDVRGYNPSVLSLSDIRKHVRAHLQDWELMFPDTLDDEDEGRGKIASLNVALTNAVKLLQLNERRFKIQSVKEHDGSVTHLQVDPNVFPIQWPAVCRMKLYFFDALWKACIAVVIIAVSALLYRHFNLQKKRANDDEKLFYDLVEKSLELIQSPDEPRSVPVLHIRDTIITPAERKDLNNLRIWENVVKFVEEKESRVKVETEIIDGEPFKAWKWVASSSSPDASILSESSPAKVFKTGNLEWQGQAFNEGAENGSPQKAGNSPSKAETFRAPTPFMKVRQMFDRDTILNAPRTWKRDVRDAILEKCSIEGEEGSHGILHLSVDERAVNEGLVYMRTRDINAATHVFNALHGWWCEKRLVSVRFLKEDRYYSRFPASQHVTSPLERDSPLIEDD